MTLTKHNSNTPSILSAQLMNSPHGRYKELGVWRSCPAGWPVSHGLQPQRQGSVHSLAHIIRGELWHCQRKPLQERLQNQVCLRETIMEMCKT